ncbi:hypothetical protein BKD26_27990 [Streptomyces sp. CB03238]|nr:hypothetical protein BKD26_27990 [Streptomyces sp. CB03238]
MNLPRHHRRLLACPPRTRPNHERRCRRHDEKRCTNAAHLGHSSGRRCPDRRLDCVLLAASSRRLFGKRVLDIVLALLALILLSPILLPAACAIKPPSAGPVLYLQERVGRRTKPCSARVSPSRRPVQWSPCRYPRPRSRRPMRKARARTSERTIPPPVVSARVPSTACSPMRRP